MRKKAISTLAGALALTFGLAAQGAETSKGPVVDRNGILDKETSAAVTYNADPDFVFRIDGRVESFMHIKAKLYELARKDATKPVVVIINSPGGDVAKGWAIADAMQTIPNRVDTICETAQSMAAMILTTNKSGYRFAHPNCTITIHEPSWEIKGTASKMMEAGISMAGTREEFAKRLAETSFLTEEQARDLVETGDTEISASQAFRLGLIDGIIDAPDKIERAKKPAVVEDGFCNGERQRRMKSLCADHRVARNAGGANGIGTGPAAAPH